MAFSVETRNKRKKVKNEGEGKREGRVGDGREALTRSAQDTAGLRRRPSRRSRGEKRNRADWRKLPSRLCLAEAESPTADGRSPDQRKKGAAFPDAQRRSCWPERPGSGAGEGRSGSATVAEPEKKKK